MGLAIFSKDTILIPNVPVDIKEGEYHSRSYSVPTRAVQAGSLRTDTIIRNLDELTVSFQISNADTFGSRGDRAATIFQELERQGDLRQSFEVVTKHKLYKDMVIADISAENKGTFNGVLVGSVTFVEYPEVELATVQVSTKTINSGTSGTTKQTASSQVDAGKVEAPDVTNNQSFLSQIASKFK